MWVHTQSALPLHRFAEGKEKVSMCLFDQSFQHRIKYLGDNPGKSGLIYIDER